MNVFSVLVVDDEPAFRDILVKRLNKRVETVASANSGRQALEMLKADPVDLVVLDIKMPDMDGIETLREIKRNFPQIEVILLTGHADVDIAMHGIELGAFDYLMKPMEIDDLLYKLQDAYQSKVLRESIVSSYRKD